MEQHVINPFNKLDLSRIPVEVAITLADKLLFGDVSAVGKQERTLTVQQFLEVLFPANLRLSTLVAEAGIILTDHLVFVDNSAIDPKERKITLEQLLAVITPAITVTATPSITPTGMITAFAGLVAPPGWLLASGLTIGNPSSGATSRANVDTQSLYNLLWTSYANAQLPIQDSAGVPGVRGVSAAVDFAAGYRLPLPDLRGRVMVGKDNMDGTAANRVTTAGSGVDGLVNGASGGSQSVTLTTGELPAHTHTTQVPTTTSMLGASGTAALIPTPTSPIASSSVGGGLPHNNTQPSIITTFIIKL